MARLLLRVLDYRLDDEGGAVERGRIVDDDLDALLVLAADALDVAAHALRRAVAAHPDDDLAVLGGDRRDARGDRAAPEDPEALAHVRCS